MNKVGHSFFRVIILSLFVLSPTQSLSQILIGAPYPQTGPIVTIASDMRAAAELAEKHVNDAGGVLGQNYKLVFKDTACKPEQAVIAVKTLIEQDKVPALVGPVCSGATLRQARSVSIPAQVVTLSGASASPHITTLRDKDLVFRTAVSDALKGREMAAYAFKMGIRDIAVSFASDAYNTGVAEIFVKTFTGYGGKVSVNQAHQPNKEDYSREAQALAAGADTLALFAYYGSSGNALLKAVFSTGKFKQIYAADGMLSQKTIDYFGEEALSTTVIFSSASDKSRTGYKIWSQLAKSADVPADAVLVANVYDSAFMMALAIEAAQSATGVEIAKGLRLVSGPQGETIYPGEFAKAREILSQGGRINYDGASGPVDFDKNGDISGFVKVNRVKNGEWVGELIK